MRDTWEIIQLMNGKQDLGESDIDRRGYGGQRGIYRMKH